MYLYTFVPVYIATTDPFSFKIINKIQNFLFLMNVCGKVIMNVHV
jgi:hypothetical protein